MFPRTFQELELFSGRRDFVGQVYYIYITADFEFADWGYHIWLRDCLHSLGNFLCHVMCNPIYFSSLKYTYSMCVFWFIYIYLCLISRVQMAWLASCHQWDCLRLISQSWLLTNGTWLLFDTFLLPINKVYRFLLCYHYWSGQYDW